MNPVKVWQQFCLLCSVHQKPLMLLQDDGDRLTECPPQASCSVGVELAVTPPEGASTSSIADAAYQSMSTSSFQASPATMPPHSPPSVPACILPDGSLAHLDSVPRPKHRHPQSTIIDSTQFTDWLLSCMPCPPACNTFLRGTHRGGISSKLCSVSCQELTALPRVGTSEPLSQRGWRTCRTASRPSAARSGCQLCRPLAWLQLQLLPPTLPLLPRQHPPPHRQSPQTPPRSLSPQCPAAPLTRPRHHLTLLLCPHLPGCRRSPRASPCPGV